VIVIQNNWENITAPVQYFGVFNTHQKEEEAEEKIEREREKERKRRDN